MTWWFCSHFVECFVGECGGMRPEKWQMLFQKCWYVLFVDTVQDPGEED